jgi:hypothetical protein
MIIEVWNLLQEFVSFVIPSAVEAQESTTLPTF